MHLHSVVDRRRMTTSSSGIAARYGHLRARELGERIERGGRQRQPRRYVAFPEQHPQMSQRSRRLITFAVLAAVMLYAGMLLHNRAPEWAVAVEGLLLAGAGAAILFWVLRKYRGFRLIRRGT